MPPFGKLDDFSWRALEAARLDGFFDEHRIPAILFPLGILALLIISVILLWPSGPAASEAEPLCGDGACDAPETSLSCLADCPPSENLKTVVVKIAGQVPASLFVSLNDADGGQICSSEGKKSEFTFGGISGHSVTAAVRNPLNGKTAVSDPYPLDAGTVTIPVSLPADFFDKPQTPKGTLRLTVRDEAGSFIRANVTVVIPNGNAHTIAAAKPIAGMGSFSLDSGNWYAVIADAAGYGQYDGRASPTMLGFGEERELLVQMRASAPEPAVLSVCVRDQGGKPVNGSARVHSLIGEQLGQKPLSVGCAEFQLSAGATVFASALETGCVGASASIALDAGPNTLNLKVTCGAQIGNARARVLDKAGRILTANATVELWTANGTKVYGSGYGGALLPAPSGYTEFVPVGASKPFYFTVSNLEAYSNYRSKQYSAGPGENKSVTITLQPPEPPEYNFTFGALTFPNPAAAGRPFAASVSRILYGQTDVTQQSNVSFELAGQPCGAAISGGVWKASCAAPDAPGTYDLAVLALYDGRKGMKVVGVNVMPVSNSYFELTPYAIMDETPPIEIGMSILFNGTPLDSPTASDVGVYYLDGGIWLPERPKLTGSGGNYTVIVNTPYPGGHRAEIYLKRIEGGVIYEQNFTISFDTELSRPGVTSEQSASPKILEPKETFTVNVRVKQGEKDVEGLANIKAVLYGQTSALAWDQRLRTYTVALFAPPHEGVYKIGLLLGASGLAELEIFVVDTSKARASECEVGDCEDRPMARQCVYDYRGKKTYAEAEIISCIRSGMTLSGGQDIMHCLEPDAGRGDWNDDCVAASYDISLFGDFFKKVPSQVERNEYAGCGDMDNDGDVDIDDEACLVNVVATKWLGDTGATDCSRRMNGGFCFNISLGEPGDLDDDEGIGQTDVAVMGRIVGAAGFGVDPHPALLNVTDFDGSGALDSADLQCLQAIAGSSAIPVACLVVYGFGCNGTPGDLTQDGAITASDVLIEGWILNDRVEQDAVLECADVTQDGALTEDDYLCIDALAKDNEGGIAQFCPYCYVEMQNLSRYGLEICHDGLDNNCNGEKDEDCTCDENFPCDRVYDEDGLVGTDDFLYCRGIGERAFYGTAEERGKGTGGSSSEGPDTSASELEYGWYNASELYAMCDGDEDWGMIKACPTEEWTCLFNYHQGAGYPGEPGGGFIWKLAAGNTGPLGVDRSCGKYDVCVEGWFSVGKGTGGECDSDGDKHHCNYCRWKYDVCSSVVCELSGKPFLQGNCKDHFELHTEKCTWDEACMGVM